MKHVRERFASENVLERNREFYQHCIEDFRGGRRN